MCWPNSHWLIFFQTLKCDLSDFFLHHTTVNWDCKLWFCLCCLESLTYSGYIVYRVSTETCALSALSVHCYSWFPSYGDVRKVHKEQCCVCLLKSVLVNTAILFIYLFSFLPFNPFCYTHCFNLVINMYCTVYCRCFQVQSQIRTYQNQGSICMTRNRNQNCKITISIQGFLPICRCRRKTFSVLWETLHY